MTMLKLVIGYEVNPKPTKTNRWGDIRFPQGRTREDCEVILDNFPNQLAQHGLGLLKDGTSVTAVPYSGEGEPGDRLFVVQSPKTEKQVKDIVGCVVWDNYLECKKIFA